MSVIKGKYVPLSVGLDDRHEVLVNRLIDRFKLLEDEKHVCDVCGSREGELVRAYGDGEVLVAFRCAKEYCRSNE